MWANIKTDYSACGEAAQSPIAIIHSQTVVNQSLPPFTHSLFQTPPNTMTLTNNGHACELQPLAEMGLCVCD